jgi:hypothetical protein
MARGRTALALAALICASPVAAQDRVARITPVLDRALAEWRVFLTCTALDPQAHAMVVDGWSGMVETTGTYLRERGLSGASLDDFPARAEPDALMLPGDTPFAEVRAFCEDHPGWRGQLETFGFILMPDALEEALAE